MPALDRPGIGDSAEAAMIRNLAATVVGTAVELVGAAHGVPGAGQPVERLMRDLMRVQDEQLAALGRLERDMQRLIEAPWKTSRIHLAECQLPGRTQRQIEWSLEKAADLLRAALGQLPPDSLPAAYAALDLAIVLVLLDDREAARKYARQAAATATGRLLAWAKANDLRVLVGARRSQRRGMEEEWYTLANAVAPICGWPMDQLDRIRQGPSWLYTDLETMADLAWRTGEVHSGWLPHGEWDQHAENQ